MTLDDGDNDPVVLWAHVVSALERAVPELRSREIAAALVSAPLLEVVLPRLVNALTEHPDVVLVLDDFHRLGPGPARESVAWFVDRVPPSVQLVVATRTDPALPLGTLRAYGQLLELRVEELRFTAAEAGEFLNGRLGLDLDAADVDLLVTRTEGWPAALYLAALSLAGAPDKRLFVRAFDGTSAHVVDFLSTEVLAGYDPELQAFMLRTSVLERLCAPLCDAVVGATDSAATLDALQRTNLLLLPLDDQRRWFRFHHLFAQMLQIELQRREPGLIQDLHRRALDWHRQSGTTEEAIDHALAGGALDEAAELIEEVWIEYANAGRTASVLDWLARIPEARLDTDRRLLTVKAWVHALRGREAEMRAAVARVHELGGLEDGPLRDGFVSVASSLSVLQTAFAWGDVSAVLEHGTRSAELEGADSPWWPVIAWSLGWAHYCNGDLDQAERWLEETTRTAPRSDQWIVGVAAAADLSLIAGMRGRHAEQLRLAEDAVEMTAGVGLLDALEDGEVHTALGAALAAQGEVDRALAPLEKGVFLRRLWGQPLDLLDGLIALAPVVAATGDPARAGELVAEAEGILAACADPGALGERLAAARSALGTDGPPGEELTDRERTVLRLLGSGLSEREIGRELFISFNTVHSHVKSIYRKLGVASREEAVERHRRLT